jgi:hypothetical protein
VLRILQRHRLRRWNGEDASVDRGDLHAAAMLAYFAVFSFFSVFFGDLSDDFSGALAPVPAVVDTGFTFIRVLASIQTKPSSLFAAAMAHGSEMATATPTMRIVFMAQAVQLPCL